MEMWYDKEADVLNLQLKNTCWASIELADGIVLDITKDGAIAALEILHASKIFTGNTKRVLSAAVQLHRQKSLKA